MRAIRRPLKTVTNRFHDRIQSLDCENEDKKEKDEENNENQIKKENNDDQEKEERKAQLIESEKTISDLRFFIDNFKVRGGKKNCFSLMFGDTHFSFRPLKDPLVEQFQKENKELKDKIASLKEKFDSELRSRSQTLKLQSSFEKFDSQHKV